jgi:hypothetical protein
MTIEPLVALNVCANAGVEATVERNANDRVRNASMYALPFARIGKFAWGYMLMKRS